WMALLSALLLLAIAWAIVPLTGAYAWPTVMRHTFMDRVLDAHDRALGFGVSDYVTALERGLHGHMTDHPARFAPYLGVAVLAAWWALMRRAADNSRAVLLLLGGAWLDDRPLLRASAARRSVFCERVRVYDLPGRRAAVSS